MAYIDLNLEAQDIKLALVDNGDGTYSLATAAGESFIGQIGGKLIKTEAEFTRPLDAAQYAIGDVVSNSTVATTPMDFADAGRTTGGSGYITGARLSTDKKSITPRFRVHLFNANNPTLAVDNAVYKEVYADHAKRTGYFDLPAMTTATDTANSDLSRSFDFTLRVPYVTAAGDQSIFAVLETLDVFIPASGEKFTLSLFFDQN